MKHLLSALLFLLSSCSLASAQFKERPGATVQRTERATTHVEGNLRKVLDFPISGRVVALGFSPQGDYLAVATATTLSLVNESGTRQLTVWDALKEPKSSFADRPALKAVVAFSSDGKRLFFCGPQGLTVWEWPQGPSVDEKPVRLWTAPNVYNATIVDEARIVCAAKKGSSQIVQLCDAESGKVVWEKESGLMPVTTLQSYGTTVRAIVGTETGSQGYWREWELQDGTQSFPVDLGAINGFSASIAPDGKVAAVVNKELSLITLDTGDKRVAKAPYHPYIYPYPYRRRNYEPYSLHYPYIWRYGWTLDTGWATLFSPDGKVIVTLGKEAVFYEKSAGTIVGRIYFSSNPYPLPTTIEAETDGVGCFVSDGSRFALVRQARVVYSASYNRASSAYTVRRQVEGASAVEIYALGVG